jgi:type II secretory pathway component PulF
VEIGVMATVLAGLCLWVVPKFARMFDEMLGRAHLPVLTACIVGPPPWVSGLVCMAMGALGIGAVVALPRRYLGAVNWAAFIVFALSLGTVVLAMFLPLLVFDDHFTG